MEEVEDEKEDLEVRNKPFRQKLRDTEYRRKFLHTLVLFSAFLVLGICDTIHFPAFLDLALITGSNVEQASVFYTAMAVGGLVGTLGMGFLFDRFPTYRSLLLAGANLGSAFTITSVPWSSNYFLTVFLFFICYIFNLAFDTGTHADLLSMWGADGKMFMQFLHFSYALGSIISPLLVEPFLAEEGAGNSTWCHNSQSLNISIALQNTSIELNEYSYETGTVSNRTSTSESKCKEFESRIHYAYLTAGIMCFVTAIVLVAEAYTKCIDTKLIKKQEDDRTSRPFPTHLNILFLTLVAILYIFMCAPGNTIPSYLMPFGVDERGWTKERTTYLISIYWAVFAASRLLAVFVIKFISPAKLLTICFVVLTASMGGLWTSVAADSDPGVWACIIASSGGFSVSFPTGFLYVEKDIMKVSGKIASLIMLATNGAGIVNPLLLGYLIQDVSMRWYIYLSFAQVIVAFVVFLILQMTLRTRVAQMRGGGTTEIEVRISDEGVDDNIVTQEANPVGETRKMLDGRQDEENINH